MYGRPTTSGVGAMDAKTTSEPSTAAALNEAAERLAHDLDAMTRLHRLSARFVRAGDLPQALEEIVDVAISITHADQGNIQLLDPGTRRLKVAAYRGHEKWWLDFFESVAEGDGASCGAALHQGGRVIVEDVTKSPVFVGTPALEVQLRAGIRAVQSTPLFAGSGELVGMISTHYRTPHRPDERDLRLLDLLARQAADMIEHVRSEESLRASEERFRLLVQGVKDYAIYMIAPDGTVESWSAAAEHIFGFREEEIVGRHRGVLFTPEQRAEGTAERDLEAALRDGRHHVEGWRVRKDGSRFFADVIITALRDDAGGLRGFANVTRDVTERRRSEAALRKSEESVRLAQQVARAGFFDWNIQSGLNTWTPELEALYGLPPGSFGRTEAAWEQMVHPEDRPELLRRMYQSIETGAPTEEEWRVVWADGSVHWIAGRWQVLKDHAGKPQRMTGVNLDVTQRKRSEDELRASEERMRLAQQVAHVGSFELNIQSGVNTWTRELEAMYGLPPGSFAGTQEAWEKLVHPDDRAEAVRSVERAFANEGAAEGEWRVVWPDGSVHWLAGRFQVMRDNSGKPLQLTGVNIDITERKATDRALRAKEAELEVILGRTPFMLARVSRDLRYRYVSAAYARMAHRTPEELAGRPMVEVLGEKGLATIRPYIEAVLRGETVEYEQEVQFVAVGPRRLQAMYVPDRDGRGEIIGWIANIIDVTEGRQAESLRAANALLVEADRQKNDFLGMLSHELRNPLAPIRSSSYILRHAQPGSEQVRRAQDVIERQTEHLTRLVDDLLDVTRVARGKIELRRSRIDLRDLVSHAAADFRSRLQDRGVRFEVVVPEEKLWTDADATRITQMIGNLLSNAAKFTRRGDEVALRLGAADGEAEIRVRDTGAGIEPSLLPSIFEAFVQGDRTLARSEGGLGLGLSLVKGIAELHGGSVRAVSAGKGEGAEFVIRLPLLAAPSAKSPEAPPAERRNGARRVLVVDDNADAAESLAEVVKMLGHDVEVAYDGPSAIEKVRTNRPDVVLCDIGLPGMSGYEVARRLRASRVNGIRLIAVSGYAGHEDVSRAVDAGFDEHVAKPCGPEQIERLLS